MNNEQSENYQNNSFDDESFSNKESDNSTKPNGFIKVSKSGDSEVTIFTKKIKNPVEILEKLYPLRHDETLTNEEKNKQVQKIMKEYME